MSHVQSKLIPLALAAVVAGAVSIPILTGSGARAQDTAPRVPAARAQWEYRALRIDDRQPTGNRKPDLAARRSASQAVLDQLGAEGWELVAVRNDGGGEPVFYFKRPKS